MGLGELTAPLVRRLERADVAALWPVPGPSDQKYTRGVVGVVAGTPTFRARRSSWSRQPCGRARGWCAIAGPTTSRASSSRPARGGARRGQGAGVGARLGRPCRGTDRPARRRGGAGVDAGQHERIRYALAVACGELAEDSGDSQADPRPRASSTRERCRCCRGGARRRWS
ncbi:hypothetical protein NKG05_05180 [Oerskovia sp. M15]